MHPVTERSSASFSAADASCHWVWRSSQSHCSAVTHSRTPGRRRHKTENVWGMHKEKLWLMHLQEKAWEWLDGLRRAKADFSGNSSFWPRQAGADRGCKVWLQSRLLTRCEEMDVNKDIKLKHYWACGCVFHSLRLSSCYTFATSVI